MYEAFKFKNPFNIGDIVTISSCCDIKDRDKERVIKDIIFRPFEGYLVELTDLQGIYIHVDCLIKIN